MLIQENLNGSETLLKLYVAIEDDRKALPPQLQGQTAPTGAPRRDALAQCRRGADPRSGGGVARADGQGQTLLPPPDVSSSGVSEAGGLQ